jgi:hypothetical protein
VPDLAGGTDQVGVIQLRRDIVFVGLGTTIQRPTASACASIFYTSSPRSMECMALR